MSQLARYTIGFYGGVAIAVLIVVGALVLIVTGVNLAVNLSPA